MGRAYSSELERLKRTVAFSDKADIRPLVALLADLVPRNLIFVGSGGSFTAATFAAALHEEYTGRLAKAVTPLETASRPATKNTAALLLSARGSNPDILKAFQALRSMEPIAAICATEQNALLRQIDKIGSGVGYGFTVPGGKDGFLATNSLIATLILLTRGYESLLGLPPADLQGIGEVPPWSRNDPGPADKMYELANADTIIALSSGWGWAAAIDLESKCSEAGLANVLLSDYRNFAHGRHNWLRRRGETTAIVSLEDAANTQLANSILRLLPDEVRTVRLFSARKGPTAGIDLISQVLHLTGLLGSASGVDPGRPPGAGLIALDLLVLDARDLRLRRRAGGTCGNVLAILSFLGFETAPIVRLGTDEAADILISDLQSVGVDCRHVQRDPAARTPRVVEFIPNRSGARHRFAFKCPICRRRLPRRSELDYEQAVESLEQMDLKLFFFDRAGPSTVRLASEARKRGALVMFEPDSFKTNCHFTTALELSDIVKYSSRRVGQPIDTWLHRIRVKPRLVVETLDGGGLRYILRTQGRPGAPWKHQNAFIVNNPTNQAGAGDWCSAGLITKILLNGSAHRWREKSISRALAFGQALAAASIRFKGPRGYLESSSLHFAQRAALSTLRLGRLPDWVAQDQERSAWSFSKDGRNGVCGLCLVPVSVEESCMSTRESARDSRVRARWTGTRHQRSDRTIGS